MLDKFIHTFYGYGRYDTPIWFLGMEEGGSSLEQRICVWNERGQRELDNAREFHLALGAGTEFFTKPTKLQKTWGRLIRLLLSTRGEPVTYEAVLECQRESFYKEAALIELFPLPSPNTRVWPYEQWWPNRAAYRRALVDWRLAHIQERIDQYNPQAVICYASSYKMWWQRLRGTKVIITHHPASIRKGNTHEYFEQIGRELRQR